MDLTDISDSIMKASQQNVKKNLPKYEINFQDLTCFMTNYKELDGMNNDKNSFNYRTILYQTNLKMTLEKSLESIQKNEKMTTCLLNYVFIVKAMKCNIVIGITDLLTIIETVFTGFKKINFLCDHYEGYKHEDILLLSNYFIDISSSQVEIVRIE